jgi:adenosylcobinamide kinase/adenosylcobinamide-phosphate guanylyltransferase
MAAAEPRLSLVSGPAGSGKSRWAEHLAERLAEPGSRRVVYLATGPVLPQDPAWQQRLERHRRRRPEQWLCREVGGNLAPALGQLAPDQLGLVDSLGTWVAAHLELGPQDWALQWRGLLASMAACSAPLVLVAEEVGWGVVPATASGNCFRERLGDLERRIGGHCDAAWLVVQGRAIDLIALGQPVPSQD